MWYCRVAIYEKQPFFVIKTCMYISRMMHLVKLDVDKDFPPNVFHGTIIQFRRNSPSSAFQKSEEAEQKFCVSIRNYTALTAFARRPPEVEGEAATSRGRRGWQCTPFRGARSKLGKSLLRLLVVHAASGKKSAVPVHPDFGWRPISRSVGRGKRGPRQSERRAPRLGGRDLNRHILGGEMADLVDCAWNHRLHHPSDRILRGKNRLPPFLDRYQSRTYVWS